MTAEQMKARIESLGPGTTAQMTDLTGTRNHWHAIVVSPAFEGKSMIDQHRMIFQLFESEVRSDEVHALTLKTYTPQQYERLRNG